jgi:hypothetical protein
MLNIKGTALMKMRFDGALNGDNVGNAEIQYE